MSLSDLVETVVPAGGGFRLRVGVFSIVLGPSRLLVVPVDRTLLGR